MQQRPLQRLKMATGKSRGDSLLDSPGAPEPKCGPVPTKGHATTTTLLQCLSTPLPRPISDPVSGTQTQPSSDAVWRETLPRLIVYPDDLGQEWSTAYEGFQKLLNEDEDSAKELRQRLTENPEPYRFENIELQNEADVVSQAGLYLVYPLRMAAELFEPDITTSCEAQVGTNLRVDLAWRRSNGDPFMHTEFKRQGYLKTEKIYSLASKQLNGTKDSELDPDSEELDSKETVSEKTEVKETVLETTEVEETVPKKTEVKRTVGMVYILKQVTAYARRHELRYSSLCDYDTLVLLEFINNYADVRITIPKTEDFRKSLLGLLLMASRVGRSGR
ncbi:hypothetical protein BU26DRAFT_239441 [Trematosphaeria pertusa]|uniref:Uncharacterized protein n=1 Tax=Trematosphaeria pertusa TaxID=390896 RepID=A0A6A6HQW9_9PLEO|nr:uncharacterized protein BU26DRAFT_239441 [Trematosphaeria pertusa]KAF2240269.1 hypothetical protein BU26DRAFT_239441 [Trematosphaeria pertusa]